MSRIILMILSLTAVIIAHIAAYFFTLNDHTTLEILNRLPVPFIPANYVFSIWIVIFIAFFWWVLNFYKNTKPVGIKNLNRITFLFVFSCALTVVWLFLWHFGFFNWTVIIEVILLLVLLACYSTFPKRINQLSGRVPFSLLTGWIFISILSNFSYTLMFHEWSGFGLSDPLWTVFYLTISTAFALHFMYHYRDYVLNLVIVWAFVGIAVKNGTEELFVSAAAIFLSAVIIACIFIFYRKGLAKE